MSERQPDANEWYDDLAHAGMWIGALTLIFGGTALSDTGNPLHALLFMVGCGITAVYATPKMAAEVGELIEGMGQPRAQA